MSEKEIGVWDLGGQERFQFIIGNYLKGSDKILNVIAVNNLNNGFKRYYSQKEELEETLTKKERTIYDLYLVITKKDLEKTNKKTKKKINYFNKENKKAKTELEELLQDLNGDDKRILEYQLNLIEGKKDEKFNKEFTQNNNNFITPLYYNNNFVGFTNYTPENYLELKLMRKNEKTVFVVSAKEGEGVERLFKYIVEDNSLPETPKVSIVGDGANGKTWLTNAFINDGKVQENFESELTIGVDFKMLKYRKKE